MEAGMGLPTTPDVKDHLERAEARIAELRLRAKHPRRPFWTLTGLLRAWHDLPDEIDHGYRLTVYDYTNDLTVRDIIDEVFAVIPPGQVRTWIEADVARSDERYGQVTHEVAEPIHGRGEMPWWFFRVPNKLVGELAEDLDQSGRR